MPRLFLFLLCLFRIIVALAQRAPAIVINEILFNPKPNGSDYVELYNRSDSSIDLQTIALTNRTSSGNYGPLKKLSDSTRLLLPGGYVVVTEDAAALARSYFLKVPDAVLQVASLPSFPNAAGTVVLLDTAMHVLDEVSYQEDWHFPLLADAEGVALERIDPSGASNDQNNWRSAASDAGYGTPGYQNSQYQLFQNPIASVAVTSKIFSPNGDGTDDVATIKYQLSEGGAVANIFVFDASGRQVRHLVKGAVLGTTGNFAWDGRDEKNQALPVGQYIIYTELFTLRGKRHRFKNVVVLARHLN